MKVFLIKIVFRASEWHYKKGEELIIPVQSNNYRNAVRRFENKCCGSEYPSYSIASVTECDDFLFQPMLQDKIKK